MDRREMLQSVLSLPVVTQVQSVRVEPEDIFIFTAPNKISDEAAGRIEEVFKKALAGHKCLVLGDGIQVSIMRK